MPVYFIRSEQVRDGSVIVNDGLAHHLRIVLRSKIGDILYLVADSKKGYITEVTRATSREFVLKIKGEVPPPSHTATKIQLGLSILKGGRTDWAIQKATELGADRISPLMTARSVVRLRPDRLKHQHERWREIVQEAAQQSGRWAPPLVDFPCDFREFLEKPSNNGFQWIFWEEASKKEYYLEPPSSCGSILIGPEGGWEPSEVNAAIQHGYQVRSLGTWIMRAETATVAALSIIQYQLAQGPERISEDQ